MFHDHTLRLVTGEPLPTHPDPDAIREMGTDGPACPAKAPAGPARGVPPYGCTRHAGHEGVHVAGMDPGEPTFLAEWDDDRGTDLTA